MAIGFSFRQQLMGEWIVARGFLVEQFDQLFANLAILSPLVDALSVVTTDLQGNPIFTVGYTASSVLTTNAAGTPSFGSTLPMPLAFASGTVLSPPALTISVNNYAPTGFAAASIIRITATGAVDITGITAASANTFHLLVNIGTNTITLKHASGSSTAANRFRCPSAGDVSLTGSSAVWIWYDVASTVWQVF